VDPNQEVAVNVPEDEIDFKREYFTIKVNTDPCDKVRLLALLNLTTKDGPVVYEDPEPLVLLQLSTAEPTPEYAGVTEEMQADEPAEKEVEEVEHDAGLEGEVKYETDNVDDGETNVEEEEEEEVTEEPTEEPFVFHSRYI